MIFSNESFYETSLTASIGAADATIPVATPPNIYPAYFVIEANTSNREIIYATSCSGNSLTGCVRGLATYGSNNSAGTGKTHSAGTDLANKDVHYYYAQYYDFLVGTSATGANQMRIGDGNTTSASDRLWYIHTSSISAFWGLSANGQMVVSEDGVTSYVVSAGGSGVTAGDGIDITAGVATVSRLSTSGFRVSSGKLAINAGQGLSATSASELYVDLTHDYIWAGAHTFKGSVSLSSVNAASASFTNSPTAAGLTATSGSHLTTKSYVDDNLALKASFTSASGSYGSFYGTSWQDVNLSATIGANLALVILQANGQSAGQDPSVAVRPNGSSVDYDTVHSAANILDGGGTAANGILITTTDTSGVIEVRGGSADTGVTLTVIGYIK